MAGNGWTREECERQAHRVRGWQPWRSSTGPQTKHGKERSSQNALKHGEYAGELEEARRLLREAWRD